MLRERLAAELSLSFDRYPEGAPCGALHVRVQSGAFAGEGCAFFYLSRFREQFLSKLAFFPIDETRLMGGYEDRCPEPCREDVVISLSQHDALGSIKVEIQLSEFDWRPERQSVTASFLTDYASLKRFAVECERMLDDGDTKAVLRGERRD